MLSLTGFRRLASVATAPLAKGSTVKQQPLHTYNQLSMASYNTPRELATFPFGQMKGKWVGLTMDQLAALSK